jgi:UDP-N-acetylmuramoylalanine--D-glutamate ligase
MGGADHCHPLLDHCAGTGHDRHGHFEAEIGNLLIVISEYAGKSVAVLGLGRTGLAAAKSLLTGGAKVLVWDDGEKGQLAAQEAGLELCDLARRDLSDLSALVLSPGIPHTFPKPNHIVSLAKACGLEIVSDIELFARALNRLDVRERPKVVGITGTNGKSTTTALVTHILNNAHMEAYSGGNIGRACLDLPAFRAGQVYVLELSSYQLELTRSLRCDVAGLLNLTPDHIDRHGNFENYAQAKARIFANQRKEDLAVIGVDDDASAAMLAEQRGHPHQTIGISARQCLSRGIFVLGGKLVDASDGLPKEIADLGQAPGLRGQHNGQNAALAYAITRHLGLSTAKITAGLYSFSGLAHRMEMLGQIANIRVVNDSKATNSEAAARALASFSNIYWIAGGIAKEDGLQAALPYLPNVRRAYLIGQDAPAFRQELKGQIPARLSKTLQQAFAHALHDANEDGISQPVILLSPACASFDQFPDFEARGEALRDLFSNAHTAAGKRGAA